MGLGLNRFLRDFELQLTKMPVWVRYGRCVWGQVLEVVMAAWLEARENIGIVYVYQNISY